MKENATLFENKVSDITYEEIELASQKAFPIGMATINNFDAYLQRLGFKIGVNWYTSIVNKKDNAGSVIKMIDEILLSKAKELNLYVDFSGKEYDGDKEAPMDRIGLLNYLVNERKDNVVNDWVRVIKNRIDYFNGHYHYHEANRLSDALININELIPPSDFESQPK